MLRGDAAIHKDNQKDAHLWDFVNSDIRITTISSCIRKMVVFP